MTNPLFALPYESPLANLGEDYYDRVVPAQFPQHILRFRNDSILSSLQLAAEQVSDRDLIEAFGQFQGPMTALALRYHGYQFGVYNPFLGDGRGFLWAQVRAADGKLYDFGTKGSGTTPYSRGGDGRLTLKGGVREVLASEALYAQGVKTSRTLSLIETGEALWRGDEPSPTRASVMVRFSHSHLRFGSFERLHYLRRPDLIGRLLDHVIDCYYPHLMGERDIQQRYGLWFAQLAERLGMVVAQWMSVGFCHGVLNTDNMSITGESFDYGPYAFMDEYDPRFTAAYFDHGGLYCFANQPKACRWNLEKLAAALAGVVDHSYLEAGLAQYQPVYAQVYGDRMGQKLGFTPEQMARWPKGLAADLLSQTVSLFEKNRVSYPDFFRALTQQFEPSWREACPAILADAVATSDPAALQRFEPWRQIYHQCLQQLPAAEMAAVQSGLARTNPMTLLRRPEIEAVWAPIAAEDNWQPFYDLLEKIQSLPCDQQRSQGVTQ